MESLRLSRSSLKVTQTVQRSRTSFISLSGCTQAPPPGPLPGGLRPQTSLIAGRRWTRRGQTFCSGGGRQGLSQGRIASQHGFTPDTSPFFRAPLPRQPATPGSGGTSPARGPPRGQLTQQEAPSPPGPGAPGAGARARGGVLRVLFVRPRPPLRAPSAPVLDFIH